MREQRKTLEEACVYHLLSSAGLTSHRRAFVAEQRPIICPNPGFLKQLAAYEAELRAERETCNVM